MEPKRVVYGKPPIKDLLKQGYSLVDMHTHTRYSDGLTPLHISLKTAAKKGIGISITDHQNIRAYRMLKNYRFQNLIIPGIEINTVEGPHILLYFYDAKELAEYFDRHIRKNIGKNPNGRTNISLMQVLQTSAPYNCLSFIAHPASPISTDFRIYLKNNPNVPDLIDGYEAIGGALPKHYIKCSMKMADNSGKCFVGGSDAHNKSEISNVITYSYADDVESFLNNIRKRQNYVMGRTCRITHRVKTTFSYIRHVRYMGTTLGSFKILYDNQMNYHVKPMLGRGISYAYTHIRDAPQKIREKINL
ncbi:histidinol-phosphatase [Candidatus Woesearchaeota archaeon]|nr:histidinol-phosphatase [Candidatus Woesearchaeota archaeon]